eukprot:12297352-Alexandrium_andersonii.AAC.1
MLPLLRATGHAIALGTRTAHGQGLDGALGDRLNQGSATLAPCRVRGAGGVRRLRAGPALAWLVG